MVYMYHCFLVHSSADGHLGCFHVLAMTNSAAMNIGVHVSLSDLVSLVCIRCFFKWLGHLHVPSNVYFLRHIKQLFYIVSNSVSHASLWVRFCRLLLIVFCFHMCLVVVDY